MKVILMLFRLLALFGALLLLSCNKDTENGSDDSYYIRYEAGTTTVITGTAIIISVATPDGEKQLNVHQNYNETFGPVKRRFTAKIKVAVPNAGQFNPNSNVKIYVSRNNEPFALKQEASTGLISACEYTIDY